MGLFVPRSLGWSPSAPDFRDFQPAAPPASELLRRLREAGAGVATLATTVDLREYFVDVYDQLDLPASSAHAVAGLIEYFERRASGRLLRPSRLFLYQNALRLAGARHAMALDLRTTLKALQIGGLPPERLWPYDPERLTATPDPLLYCYASAYRSMFYVRLDERRGSGPQTLHTVKALLAAGFPSVFGFGVPCPLSRDGNIAYRPSFDSIAGGQALVAVGYDDRWLGGSRGALLVRSSWGPEWGELGYGWLPYAFVEEQLAVDFWTLLRADWIDSGEFDAPDIADS